MQSEYKMNKIKEIVLQHTTVDNVDFDSPLSVYGVDSLSIIEIILEVENFFETEIDNSKLNYSSLKTIRSISNLI